MHIAFIGLGAMGFRMARRLVEAGYQLTVHNRTKARAAPLMEAGAAWAPDPARAVAEADLVFSMVRDDEASRSVWVEQGAMEALPGTAVALEASTLSRGWILELAGQFQARRKHLLEAPVVGSRPQAEGGQLVVLLGGAEEPRELAKPVLQSLGSTLETGPIGTAAACKLSINTLFAVQTAALAEQLQVLERTSIPPDRALKLLGQTPVLSPVAAGLGALMARKSFEPLFPIELVEKDLAYALELAKAQNVRPTVASAAHASFQEAKSRGLGDLNLTAVAQIHER